MEYIDNKKEDTYGILNLQDKILKIAVFIDNICAKHNISYYLMGGSALGALRHQGFIPWDDDLDIFMTPDNYERFRMVIDEIKPSDYYLQELGACKNGMVASAKLRLNNTAYIESAIKDMHVHQGIFVDIFILHNCPTNRILQLYMVGAAKYLLLKGQSYKQISYGGMKGLIMSLVRLLPKKFLYKHALSVLYRYDRKETELVCHLMGKAFYKKGIYKKDYFKSACRVAFENTSLLIPVGSDDYLRDRFGDYMKMPPKESIKLAQHAEIWDTKKDFSEYINKSRSFADEDKLV